MVGFSTSFNYYEVGSGDLLHSFFSSVAYHLEGGKWGTRFPVLMNELYYGELSADKIPQAIDELNTITAELKKYPPDKVIWDIEDLTKRPPWGDNISADITDLSNYYVTSDGEDFITIFMHALQKAGEIQKPLAITQM